MTEINVLSLFDGFSCGQQALEKLGIKVNKYFASEIDKYAIKACLSMFTNTIKLGSVIDVNVNDLPKIDLLLGGSPCQSFSFAGKRKGMSTKDEIEILTLEHYLQLKNDCYEFEGQSYLFWEYMRILTELRAINPNVKFILENVMMGEKWEKVLSKAIGVQPIEINSALVSAQNRRRLYWTNIGLVPGGLFGYLESIIEQPKDKGILLKDVLESEVDEKYFLSENATKNMKLWEVRNKEKGNGFKLEIRNSEEKSTALSTGSSKSSSTFIKIDKQGNIKNNQDKASCFTAGGHSGGNHSDMDLIIVHNTMPRSSKTGKGGTGPLSRTDGKVYCLDTGSTNAVELRKVIQINEVKESGGKQPYQQDRVYDINGISPALCRNKSDLLIFGCDFRKDEGLRIRENGKSGTLAARAREDESCGQLVFDTKIRRLTPRECFRLQTVSEDKIEILLNAGVSDSQLYKMAGNGWTIDVIAHILNYLTKPEK